MRNALRGRETPLIVDFMLVLNRFLALGMVVALLVPAPASAGDSVAITLLARFQAWAAGTSNARSLFEAARAYLETAETANEQGPAPIREMLGMFSNVDLGAVDVIQMKCPKKWPDRFDSPGDAGMSHLKLMLLAAGSLLERAQERWLAVCDAPQPVRDRLSTLHAWRRALDGKDDAEIVAEALRMYETDDLHQTVLGDALLEFARRRGSDEAAAMQIEQTLLANERYRPKIGLEVMRLLAVASFMPAQVELSRRYESGLGVDRDIAKAVYWRLRSAGGGARAGPALARLDWLANLRDFRKVAEWLETEPPAL